MSSASRSPVVESASTRMHVGEWTVLPALRRLHREDEVVRVSPKAMAVLVQLAGRAGDVVRREELLASVWHGTLPTEDVLTHAIAELRRVFNDNRAAPRYIETIPKAGYRLIAPLTSERRPHSSEPSLQPRVPRSRGHLVLTLGTSAMLLVGLIGVLFLWQQRNPDRAAQSAMLDLSTRQITSEPGMKEQPALSPGGERVAYVARPQGNAAYNLFVRSSADAPLLQLTDSPYADFFPAWSPDGSHIAFVRFGDRSCQVMVIPAVGGEPRELTQCPPGAATSIDWSPDGGWIAFSWFREGQETATLHETSVETGEVRSIVYEPEPPYHDVYPRYSPDGARIVFQRWQGAYTEAFVVPRRGGAAVPVTSFKGNILGSAWWTDGESVVVSSDHAGPRGLWRVPLAGGDAEYLGLPGAQRPSTARGTRSVAFERRAGSSNLALVDLTGSPGDQPALLYPSTRRESSPRYSPDGKRLLFVSARTGTDQLWIAENGQASKLTHHGSGEVDSPEWHPDNRHAFYVLRQEQRGSLFIVDTESKRVKRVRGPRMDVQAATVDPDGQHIYLTAESGGERRVWRTDPDGENAVPLPITGAHSLAIDAAGRYLYFSKLQGDGLWRAPLAGGDTEKISSRVKFWNRAGWVLMHDAVYYLDMAPDGAAIEILSLDLATRQTLRMHESGLALADPVLEIAPDGRSAILVVQDHSESDVFVARLD